MLKLLVVDDDYKDQNFIRMSFPETWSVTACSSGFRALDLLASSIYDIILLDIVLPDLDGLAVLQEIRKLPLPPPVIIVSGISESRIVSKAFKAGAHDYVEKPCSVDELKSRITETCKVTGRTKPPDRNLEENPAFSCFLGTSREIRQVKKQMLSYAPAESPVLLTGESGTGKEVAAKIIHKLSRVYDGPFVPVNCGAVPESLFESQFFGSEKGAFTDAVSRPGTFEQADGGTVFLDEIGEMGTAMQVKLLRVLEQKEIFRVGGDRPRALNVRVVSATNTDIRKAVEAGKFRHDLYFRIGVLNIQIPPLRNRREDIHLLAEHFMKISWENQYPGSSCPELGRSVLWKLTEYDWPGNIRELKNVIERAVLLCERGKIEPEMILFM